MPALLPWVLKIKQKQETASQSDVLPLQMVLITHKALPLVEETTRTREQMQQAINLLPLVEILMPRVTPLLLLVVTM